jgi:hypothetical protein
MKRKQEKKDHIWATFLRHCHTRMIIFQQQKTLPHICWQKLLWTSILKNILVSKKGKHGAFFFNFYFNPLNAKLNLICHLLALLEAHPILHVGRIRFKRAWFPAQPQPQCLSSLRKTLTESIYQFSCKVYSYLFLGCEKIVTKFRSD